MFLREVIFLIKRFPEKSSHIFGGGEAELIQGGG